VTQFAALTVFGGSPYDALVRGASSNKLVIYRTDSTAFTVENQDIDTQPVDPTVDITVSGTPVRVWETIVTPDPVIANNSSPANVGVDDTWRLKVAGNFQSYFTVTTETTIGQVATGIAGTVSVTNVSAFMRGNAVVLRYSGGASLNNPVVVGPLEQVRAAAYDKGLATLSASSSGQHYARVEIDIADAGAYKSGQTYVVVINGQRIEFTTVDANGDGVQKLNEFEKWQRQSGFILTYVADAFAQFIESKAPKYRATAIGSKITISDREVRES
jgi:hypothetical protein